MKLQSCSMWASLYPHSALPHWRLELSDTTGLSADLGQCVSECVRVVSCELSVKKRHPGTIHLSKWVRLPV